MEGGYALRLRICVCASMRALGTASFYCTLTVVFVCAKESEGGREGGVDRGAGGFVSTACRGSFSRHIAFGACKINTLQYLRKARLSALF